MFANGSGNPADMHNFTERVFRPLLKKANLRPIRLLDTRHSFASLLLAQGEPITYVSDQLGHANPQITPRIYSRWIPHESQRDAVNKLPSPSKTASQNVNLEGRARAMLEGGNLHPIRTLTYLRARNSDIAVLLTN